MDVSTSECPNTAWALGVETDISATNASPSSVLSQFLWVGSSVMSQLSPLRLGMAKQTSRLTKYAKVFRRERPAGVSQVGKALLREPRKRRHVTECRGEMFHL